MLSFIYLTGKVLVETPLFPPSRPGQFCLAARSGDFGMERAIKDETGRKKTCVWKARQILFVGTFDRKLDSSNRFRLPREILHELASGKVERIPCLSISGECLVVFPPIPFREMVDRFSNIEISNPQHRQLARDLFANTENCRIDAAGRMMLPMRLRKCAGIRSALVLAGAGRYFEIWSKERFYSRRREETGELLKEWLLERGHEI